MVDLLAEVRLIEVAAVILLIARALVVALLVVAAAVAPQGESLLPLHAALLQEKQQKAPL